MFPTEMQAPVAAARGLFKSKRIWEGVGRGDNLALLARAAAPAPRAATAASAVRSAAVVTSTVRSSRDGTDSSWEPSGGTPAAGLAACGVRSPRCRSSCRRYLWQFRRRYL